MPTESLTALIAGASAVLAGLVTGLITFWSTRGADDRADQRERARGERDLEQRQRDLAEVVADAFRDELMKVRGGTGPDQPPFDELYFHAWWERIEMDLRQPVDRLQDEILRTRLTTIIDCVPDVDVWERQWNKREEYVSDLLGLGRELAMAGVRGQDPDGHLVAAIDRYTSEMRIAQEQRDARLRAKRAAGKSE